MRRRVRQRWNATGRISTTSGRLTRSHPRRRLNESLQRLDDLQTGLLRCAKQGTRDRAVAWRNLTDRLVARPSGAIVESAARIFGDEPAAFARVDAGSSAERAETVLRRWRRGCVCWGRNRCWPAVIRLLWTPQPARSFDAPGTRRRASISGRACRKAKLPAGWRNDFYRTYRGPRPAGYQGWEAAR